MSALSDFLEGASPDALGRAHAEILAWPDSLLEARHDFIQWLFPLPEASRAVPGSPILTASEAEALRLSGAARANVAAAAERMRDFYAANDHWLVAHDHNLLRITRIIRSLRLLLGDREAELFRCFILDRVRATGSRVNPAALQFWASA